VEVCEIFVFARSAHRRSVHVHNACTTLAGPPPKNGKDHGAAEPQKFCKAKYPPYTDESGTVLFYVEHYEYRYSDGSFVINKDGKRKKTFIQKRPDPNKPGEWIYNVDGVRVVPYRLPELIEAIANDQFVIIVEGEAKVEFLRAWNIPATCNAMGAGKWKAEHAEFLCGADVVMLPDNDDTGFNHADVVGASLQGIAKSVRVLELPELGQKDDIIDWAKHGGTVERLHDLITREAKPWTARTKSETDDDKSNSKSDEQETEKEKLPPLPFLNVAAWDNEPVPEQEWSVDNRLPLRQAVLFSGEGAAGKSTTYLHLAAAHTLTAAGTVSRDWLNSLPEPGPVFFVECEDGGAAVANHYGVTFADMVKGGLHLISLAGQDAVIAAATRSGKLEPTQLFHQLYQAAGDIKPKMIGIASSANVFAGSEIDRAQVQQFVSLLTRLAIVANGTCHLLSHPSLTGINTDTGLSGNTQWHNAVRARAYFKGVKPESGEQLDTDLRELVFKKNNYGSISESIVLRYQNGLFLPVQGAASLDKVAQEAKADEVFLQLLARFTRENRNASDKPGPSYAPAKFAVEDEAKRAGLNSKTLEAAMRRLFKSGNIWNEQYGKPSQPHYRLAVK
jgi:RecA-family ATPase